MYVNLRRSRVEKNWFKFMLFVVYGGVILEVVWGNLVVLFVDGFSFILVLKYYKWYYLVIEFFIIIYFFMRNMYNLL